MKSKIARNLLKMNAMSRISRRIFLALALCVTGLAQAQLSIEITGAGANRIPVTIVDFPGDPTAARVITATVRADLERSGQFRFVEPAAANLDETTRPDLTVWRGKGIDSLVVGSVLRLADGRFDVRFRLWWQV